MADQPQPQQDDDTVTFSMRIPDQATEQRLDQAINDAKENT